MRKQQCKYCGAVEGAPHLEICPTTDSRPDWAKKEWERAFEEAIEKGDTGHWWHYASKPYMQGYVKGLDELAQMLEAADNCRCDHEY